MILTCITVTIICACADLAIKAWIETKQEIKCETTKVCKKLPFKIRRLHNRGFLMNTFEENPKLVKETAFVVTMLLAMYQMFLLASKRSLVAKLSGAIMLGGAIGNLYDRLIRGYVVDYVSIKTKWERVARIVFNLADICILLGGLGIVLFHKKAKNDH